MQQIQASISRRLRWIVFIKRYIVALSNHLMPVKNTYAQEGEDLEIEKFLHGFDLTKGIYIDVGANQPSYISNTYLFYRKQLQGVLVEPDSVNCWLLRHFRGRDITIKALAGSSAKLCSFNHSVASVRSSVLPMPDSQILQKEYIPQITVDEIYRCINPELIYLLTIDTEGFDFEVLQGAKEALERTLLVCVEYNNSEDKSKLEHFMHEHSFHSVFANDVNLLFRNNKFVTP